MQNTTPDPQHEPHSNADLIWIFDRGVPRTAWRILARNQARALFDLVQEAEEQEPRITEQHKEAVRIRRAIYRAVDAAHYRPGGWTRLQDWYAGGSIETAWAELHSAGERLLLVQDPASVLGRVPDIDAALRSNLKEDDPRLGLASTYLAHLATKEATDIDEAIRKRLADYQRFADQAGDEAHANVRSFRNLLFAIGVLVILGLAAIAILHAVSPNFIDLSTPGATKQSDAIDVWQVEGIGALGGLIAAVFTIAKLGGFAGPYRLPAYQALIRVPAGAAVSLAAVILVQSGQISALKPQSALGILAIALIFGYAPDVLLRFMDQKATFILGQAQSKNDPARPPLTRTPT